MTNQRHVRTLAVALAVVAIFVAACSSRRQPVGASRARCSHRQPAAPVGARRRSSRATSRPTGRATTRRRA